MILRSPQVGSQAIVVQDGWICVCKCSSFATTVWPPLFPTEISRTYGVAQMQFTSRAELMDSKGLNLQRASARAFHGTLTSLSVTRTLSDSYRRRCPVWFCGSHHPTLLSASLRPLDLVEEGHMSALPNSPAGWRPTCGRSGFVSHYHMSHSKAIDYHCVMYVYASRSTRPAISPRLSSRSVDVFWP